MKPKSKPNTISSSRYTITNLFITLPRKLRFCHAWLFSQQNYKVMDEFFFKFLEQVGSRKDKLLDFWG